MKKIFLFAAAVVAAMTVNAATWDFSVDTINVLDAANAYIETNTFKLEQKESSEKTPYVAVNYDLAESAEAVLEFATSPVQIKFAFSNKDAKTEVLKFYNSYLQIARKGTKMTVACAAGDSIHIYYKSYGKATEFAVTGAEPAVGVLALKASADEVLFDTSAPSDGGVYAQSCQFIKIVVGAETQGVENVKDAVKAVKTFENGQLVIIKNGVRYNALGAQL